MKRFELKGWHVLAWMLGFFGITIAVNVAFAVVAVQSFPGEDVRRSYVQGIRFNEVLSERREQAALGWRVAAAFARDERGAAVVVTIADAEGRPVSGADLSGSLQWFTDSKRDRALSFTSIGEGRYQAPVEGTPEGRWRLRARAERESEALDFEAELTWL